jgi:PST family polysaccharide transporter
MPFARILRSSALMGGAQIVVLAVGFMRTKVVALVFGATGIGLIGVLNTFNGNIASFAGWGLATSGVRTIAGATDAEKSDKIAAVRRLGYFLSWTGLLAAALLFWPMGRATFSSDSYALEMAIAGLAVPCLVASGMWSALLQATGRVKTLAKIQIIGALGGLILGLPFIYSLGTEGVALSVFFAAAVPAIALWNAARRHCPPVKAKDNPGDLSQLLKLGGALMVVGWLAQLSAYGIRLIIVRQSGLESAGYYQAAYALAGSLPGFVFAAMSADFFPRIAAARDESEAADVAEKQIQAGLLLALPLLAILLTMGKLCVYLLFARTFDGTLSLLPWMIWGVFLRLLAWPLGYWLLARGSARAVILVELFGNLVATLLPWLLLPSFGLEGAAIGFFVSYALYAVVMLSIARFRSGRWLGGRTLGVFAGAALMLLLAQVSVAHAAGLYWGLLPSAMIALGCLWVYRRALRTD